MAKPITKTTKKTGISIFNDTWLRLNVKRRVGESMDQIMNRLMDDLEELQKEKEGK
jgi:hypothetical protein